MAQWWYCLVHQKVEPEEGCPNSERLGPFDNPDDAAHALDIAAKRNEEWEAGDDEWDGKPVPTDGAVGVEETGDDD